MKITIKDGVRIDGVLFPGPRVIEMSDGAALAIACQILDAVKPLKDRPVAKPIENR